MIESVSSQGNLPFGALGDAPVRVWPAGRSGSPASRDQGSAGGRSGAAAAPPLSTSPLADASVLLSAQEQRDVQVLQQRDAEVRQHEQAHKSAGVGITGAANYEYKRGPDGQLYAVSGEVSVDLTPAATPEATISKMDAVIRSALAPADPSAQDLSVAAQARAIQQQARLDLQEQQNGVTADPTKTKASDQGSVADSGTASTWPSPADQTRGLRAYQQAVQTLPRLDQIVGLQQQQVQLIA